MHFPLPTIVWLDANFAGSGSSFHVKLTVHEPVRTFTDVSSCNSYIQSHPDETMILIVSGTLALEIVPQVYELANVSMIFVFCASMKSYVAWAMDYCDKLMMFDHEDDLLQRLWSHVEGHLRELAKESSQQADLCKERVKQLQQSCG